MPAYKRFADNSVQSSSSYQVFNKNDINSQVPTPQQQQQQREHYNIQQKRAHVKALCKSLFLLVKFVDILSRLNQIYYPMPN